MEIKTIHLGEIKVPDGRQRQDFPEKYIKELADSIEVNGLLHAPVVTPDFQLVAGECRLRALALLYADGKMIRYNGELVAQEEVPVVLTDKASEGELFRIELEENIRRKNLTFVEQAKAITQLHEYFKEQQANWNNKDTAAVLAELRNQPLLASTQAEVSNSLLLSEFAEDPEVNKARTKGAALRIAKKKKDQTFRELMGAAQAVSPVNINHIQVGDSLEQLAGFESGWCDGFITDPPYGINANEFGDAGFMGGQHGYKDDHEFSMQCYMTLSQQAYRICKDQAHLYAFLDIRNFLKVRNIFLNDGWDVWPTPLIWYKGSTAHAPKPDYGPKRTYEAILFANKGKMMVQHTGTDVIITPGVLPKEKLHPAEKPVPLLLELMKYSFLPGMSIMDPFCGCGSTLVAAKEFGLTAYGIEFEEKFANIARQRLMEDDDAGSA